MKRLDRWIDWWMMRLSLWPLNAATGRHWTLRLLGLLAIGPWAMTCWAVGSPLIMTWLVWTIWDDTR